MVGSGQAGGRPPAAGTTDIEARHDDLSIDELYRLHAAAMYRVAVSVVRDHALAEDVVHEATIRAWRYLDTFRGDGSPKSWLLRITHNTAVSMLRKLKDTPHDPMLMPETRITHVEEAALDGAFLSAFETALFELDEISRSAVALREIEGMAYEDIAEVLGVPLSTVKTRLFRARARLGDRLAPWRT